MRILVTIPHYYRATNLGYYGSLHPDSRARLHGLTSCLSKLHQSFGPSQGLIYARQECLRPTNLANENVLDIVVCTTGSDHLVEDLPPGLCRHHSTQASPPLLGYECHSVLRDNIGRYDWYVYLEDDLGIEDALFFEKLKWFNSAVNNDSCVLQANRFELSTQPPLFRLYIDGQPRSPSFVPSRAAHDTPNVINMSFLGGNLKLQKVDNPHCGGFFLTDAQMRRWAATPDFLDRAQSYIGPLESAATLGLIRHFSVYKPSRENAGFLEIEHLDPRYLNRQLEFDAAPPHRFRVVKTTD